MRCTIQFLPAEDAAFKSLPFGHPRSRRRHARTQMRHVCRHLERIFEKRTSEDVLPCYGDEGVVEPPRRDEEIPETHSLPQATPRFFSRSLARRVSRERINLRGGNPSLFTPRPRGSYGTSSEAQESFQSMGPGGRWRFKRETMAASDEEARVTLLGSGLESRAGRTRRTFGRVIPKRQWSKGLGLPVADKCSVLPLFLPCIGRYAFGACRLSHAEPRRFSSVSRPTFPMCCPAVSSCASATGLISCLGGSRGSSSLVMHNTSAYPLRTRLMNSAFPSAPWIYSVSSLSQASASPPPWFLSGFSSCSFSSSPASSLSSPTSVSVALAAQQRLAVTAPSPASLPVSSVLSLNRRQQHTEHQTQQIDKATTVDDCLVFFSEHKKHRISPEVFLFLLRRIKLIVTTHLVRKNEQKHGGPTRGNRLQESAGEQEGGHSPSLDQTTGGANLVGTVSDCGDFSRSSSTARRSSSSLHSSYVPSPKVVRAYLHQYPEFREVQRFLLKNLDKFPVNDLLSSLSLFQQLNVCPRLLLRASAPLLLRQLPQLTLSQVAQLLRVYVHSNTIGAHETAATSGVAITVCREVTYWLHACSKELGKLECSVLADLVDAGSRTPANQIGLLRLLRSIVQQRMHLMNSKQLSLVLHAYAKHPAAADDFILQQSMSTLLARHDTDDMSLSSLLRCIWAASAGVSKTTSSGRGQCAPSSLWREQRSHQLDLLKALVARAEGVLLKQEDQLDGQAVATLAWACSRGGGAAVGSLSLLEMLQRRALRVHAQMTPQGISNTLWSLAISLGRVVEVRMDRGGGTPVSLNSARRTPAGAGDSSPHGHGVQAGHHCESAGRSDSSALPTGQFPSPGDCTEEKQLCTSAAQADEAPSSHLTGETLCILLFQHVEPSVFRSLPRFEPQDLATLAEAYALLRCGSDALHSAVQQLLIENWADELGSDQLVRVLHAYAVLRGSSRLFSAVQVNLLRRLETFSVHGLCDVIWSYVVMRYLDQQFLEMCLSLVPLERVAGDDRCALLFPAALEISLAVPTADQIRLQRMRKYTREAFWELQLHDFPASFAASVASVAKSLSISSVGVDQVGCESTAPGPENGKGNEKSGFRERAVAANYEVKDAFDFDGYLIDVWLQPRQETPHQQAGSKREKVREQPESSESMNLGNGLAILCHTSQTVHRETGRPLGPAIMRHRHLRRRRIPAVHVLWDFWKALPSIESRRRFLQEKIQRALKEEKDRRASHALNIARHRGNLGGHTTAGGREVEAGRVSTGGKDSSNVNDSAPAVRQNDI